MEKQLTTIHSLLNKCFWIALFWWTDDVTTATQTHYLHKAKHKIRGPLLKTIWHSLFLRFCWIGFSV